MDSQETTVAKEATDAQANVEHTEQEVQAKTEERYYSQKEFDDAMAKMKHSVLNKALKPYQELGDYEQLRSLKKQFEQKQTEEAMKKGEFEKVLQEMASKKDAEIQKRDSIIKEYKVDSPLLNTAAKYRSINPEQVKSLLKSNVRLSEDGEVEVVDTTGVVRYKDNGTPMGVEDLVKEFLDTNPHFVQPTPSTTNTRSSIDNRVEGFDISKLDMSNPEHRKKYAEWRDSQKTY